MLHDLIEEILPESQRCVELFDRRVNYCYRCDDLFHWSLDFVPDFWNCRLRLFFWIVALYDRWL